MTDALSLESRLTAIEAALRAAGLMPQHDEVSGAATRIGRLARIVAEVAEEYGVARHEIMGRHRDAGSVEARQEAMRRAREAGMSYSQIARLLDRDHTTIIHGVRAAERRLGQGA